MNPKCGRTENKGHRHDEKANGVTMAASKANYSLKHSQLINWANKLKYPHEAIRERSDNSAAHGNHWNAKSLTFSQQTWKMYSPVTGVYINDDMFESVPGMTLMGRRWRKSRSASVACCGTRRRGVDLCRHAQAGQYWTSRSSRRQEVLDAEHWQQLRFRLPWGRNTRLC